MSKTGISLVGLINGVVNGVGWGPKREEPFVSFSFETTGEFPSWTAGTLREWMSTQSRLRRVRVTVELLDEAAHVQ